MIEPRSFSSDPAIPTQTVNVEANESAEDVELKVDSPTANGHSNDSEYELDEHSKVAVMALYKRNQEKRQ